MMMLIQDMFVKPIDRDIKGVIKVGQADDENIRQELDEYVVTKEMQKHFADFFASYKKGIAGRTDKMGVWISGFFGSGKSHFLKILSYLLENKAVNGRKAFEFFTEDKKISDSMVLADMTLASNVSTDVILFNIDSKSDVSGKQSKNAIVSVFLKAFNEMQGLCASIPFLADLERTLIEANIYEEFKQLFEKNYKKTWMSSRHKFDFIQDVVVEVLVTLNFMSEAAARNWCEKAAEPYQISIEQFAKLVKDYIDRKGNNHHVVFLVDEIGQYIGDDSKLMLNLQTVTEDLGTACQGKAWVIVTSQQDIDAIAKDMGLRSNDFSKIQGRFDTRLSLSSANVDEVIKKRILEKNQTADETLRLLYEQKSTVIKNLIVFNDGVEKKLYVNEQDFSAVYPFIPYQFNLLGDVLTSIRQHGASGKHLSEGERSMLALFKESAVRIMNNETGALVPFNVFYDALHQFLDHRHKGVIIRAASNTYINPNQEEDCFNVNVLKTLFMIKYVKEVTAHVDNIVSLMINHVDTDRIALKKKVEDALKVLVDQTLVQKHGEVYVFLTDEEQEINQEIKNQTVEMAEVIAKVSELIFTDIYGETKYRYPAFNGRYHFLFNQFVDDRLHRPNQNYDIGVRVLTPNSEYADDEMTLRMISGQNKEVLIVLPNDAAFLEEVRSALKIEKYLRTAASGALTKFQQIKDAKNIEMNERSGRAKLFLTESLKQAQIYVNGDKVQIGAKDVSTRINEAIGKLVSIVYHKLPYINVAVGEVHIRELFNTSMQQSLTLEGGEPANANALRDVLEFISLNAASHLKTSMKSIMTRFMKAPYGFVEDDVEWLVAYLFKNGDISFTVNGSSVTLLNKTSEEIIRYVTKREFVEKLLVDRREKATDQQKKTVRELSKEIFGISIMSEDDDAIMQDYQRYSQRLLNDIEKIEIMMQQNNSLPGRTVVSSGKLLLRNVLQIQVPADFFQLLHRDRDDYLDFADMYEPIKLFFNGEQKNIFERAIRLMAIFDESKTFIVDEQVELLVADIKGILKKNQPYTDIPKLPDLLDKFAAAYTKVLDEMAIPVRAAVDDAKERIVDVLHGKPYQDAMSEHVFKLFQEIYDKLQTCNNVATLQNIRVEADALKVRLLNEMDAKDRQFVRERAKQAEQYKVNSETATTTEYEVLSIPKVKKRRNISIKSINLTNSWQIETQQDVEKYIAALRERILRELDEETVINIEF
jgi:hypothetical protein